MKWLRFAETAASLVAAALVAALFAVLIAGVFARYALGHPLAWADELAVVLFIWLVFWTAAFALRTREHVAFDIVYEWLPPAQQRWVGIAASAACALLLAYALPKVADYIAFLWRERTPVLQWRQDWIYVCFVLFIGMAALRFAATAIALWRGPRS